MHACRHIISHFLALSSTAPSCTHTHLVELEDGPSLLTVWRPHDFIFGAVRGGPHYVSARLNGLFVLAWLWSSSAWGCVSPAVPLRLWREGEGWMKGGSGDLGEDLGE